MSLFVTNHEHQFAGFLDGASGFSSVRPPREPSDLLVEAANRLLDRTSPPLRVRQDLHSLRRQTRRVAADRSGFALVVRSSWEWADNHADALWFARAIEWDTLGRKLFPVPPTCKANKVETDANGVLDYAQIMHRDRKTPSTLDDLLAAALLQEFATKQLAASEATEMRVRHVLMGRA